jgi:hypothetical protein
MPNPPYSIDVCHGGFCFALPILRVRGCTVVRPVLCEVAVESVKPRPAFLQTSDAGSAASPALAESKHHRRMRIHRGTRMMRLVHQHILRFFQSFGSSLVSRIATLVSAKVTAFMCKISIRTVNKCGDLQIDLQIAKQNLGNCFRARPLARMIGKLPLVSIQSYPRFTTMGDL